jgi:hypothetical protein
MPAISDDIIGLQNTITTINETDQRLNKNVQRYTGTTIPSQVVQNQIRNKKLIIWQIGGLPEQYTLPDLIMKINPENLNSQYSQLINHKRTWGGFIEEHWGEQLDSLSASGKSAQFYGELGLTNEGRRDTDNFKAFNNFIAMYRNNGTLYDPKTGRILAQGYVTMNYDDAVYRGYFENFSLNELAKKPFELQYDISFKITKEVFPGRVLSFSNITTVLKPGALRNDRTTLDIVNIPNGTTT